jgi:hypothetical protein
MATPLWRIRNVTNVPHCGTRFLNPQESDAGSLSQRSQCVTLPLASCAQLVQNKMGATAMFVCPPEDSQSLGDTGSSCRVSLCPGEIGNRLMRALLNSFVSHDKDDVLACQILGRRGCHRQLISHNLELALLTDPGPRLVP